MAENDEQVYIVDDFSGGLQRKTSRFQQRDNQVDVAENVNFEEVGGFGKKTGYTQQNSDLTSTTSTSTSTSTTSTSSSTSTTTS